MAQYIERRLKSLANEDEHIAALYKQWLHDKPLISQALQSVQRFFSHYSLHDESHSRSILTNIERLLGDNLDNLQGTDCWLLLEAGYWHDIGMIITAEDIQDLKYNVDFEIFVEDLARRKGTSLAEKAQQFLQDKVQTQLDDIISLQSRVDGYHLLLAEWFRPQHAERSSRSLQDPFKRLGLATLSQNSLIPNRLYLILSNICTMHTQPFEEVINRLAFCQAGISLDNCHPRFIACMLRLGDLLDMDDIRFSSVSLRMLAENTETSEAHQEKHKSIIHLRLDSERIEATALCKTIEGYVVTWNWFDMLRRELQSQTSQWLDIVPNYHFASLPTMGHIEVTLEGWRILSPGHVPSFSLDTAGVIALLQGAGLYNSPFKAMRELLQNAVDATLMRIWLDKETEYDKSTQSGAPIKLFSGPTDSTFVAMANQHPINVRINQIGHDTEENLVYRVSVADMGIGISHETLREMQKIANYSKGRTKKLLIRRMPEWMKPSGIFGIGLQSAFLLTDTLHFKTKSYFSNPPMDVSMHNPNGEKEGKILIHEFDDIHSRHIGTTLDFDFFCKKIPTRITSNIFFGHINSATDKIIAKLEPITDTSLPISIHELLEEIATFSKLSPIPVIVWMAEELVLGPDSVQQPDAALIFDERSVSEVDMEFSYEPQPPMVYYRGQYVSRLDTRIPFLNSIINIMHQDADKLISIDRNKILPEAKGNILDTITSAVLNALQSGYQFKNELQRQLCSAYLEITEQSDSAPAFNDLWKDASVFPDGGPNWNTLIGNENYIINFGGKIQTSLLNNQTDTQQLEIDGKTETYPAYHTKIKYDNSLLPLFCDHWHKKGFSVQLYSTTLDSNTILFSKTKRDPYSKDVTKNILLEAFNRPAIGGRIALPIIPQYGQLASQTTITWVEHPEFKFHRHLDHFILPFFFDRNTKKISVKDLDALCAWTLQHAVRRNSTTIQEIHDLYNKLIDYIDTDVMKGNETWASYRSGT